MQGPSAFWLREQRAAAARAVATGRQTLEPSSVRSLFPSAPLLSPTAEQEEVEESVRRQPVATTAQAGGSSASTAPAPKTDEDAEEAESTRETLEKLRNSDELQRLRLLVRRDPK
ncbi:unnamed protein product, partial [Polarella glacialis]